jgi:hypothetical protein
VDTAVRANHLASALRRVRSALRRRGVGPQISATVVLVVLTVLASAGIVRTGGWVPPAVYMLIELLGAFPLRLRGMLVLCSAIVVEVVVIDLTGLVEIRTGDQLVLSISIVALVAFTAYRDRLGLQGAPGDLMIVDLRDRLAAHGRIPPLPAGWRVDTAMRSANAEAFSGDFIVAARSGGGSLLEVVLVDVSGKGQGAGVRSLQLSGAFGGLLGSMPREQFLTVANDYLLERSWEEGFATAIHLAVDLSTGRYWIASAGHPPALHRHAGSGLLEIIDTIGAPALGIVADLRRVERSGQLEHGDVLMMYTDGVVEVPGYDLGLGIDRLMGATERVVATGRGGAEAVLAAVRAGESDDRGLVLVHRD